MSATHYPPTTGIDETGKRIKGIVANLPMNADIYQAYFYNKNN